MRDQAPLEQVERALPRFVILANDKEFLARGSIVAAGHVAQAAVAAIKALDNSEAKRS